MAVVKDFFNCFNWGLFNNKGIEKTVLRQTPEENLIALKNTLEKANHDNEQIFACETSATVIFEHALLLNRIDYMQQAIEITQSRVNRINDILNSSEKILIFDKEQLDQEDLEYESANLQELIQTHMLAIQYKMN